MKSNLLRLVAITCILQLFSSCRTVRVVEQVPVRDTLHVYHTDSTHTTDSIIVEKQTTIREADSAMLAEYGIRLADGEKALLVLRSELERVSSKTSSSKSDTVYRFTEVPVPMIKTETVVKPLFWWQKSLMWLGSIAILALAFWIIYTIRIKQIKR